MPRRPALAMQIGGALSLLAVASLLAGCPSENILGPDRKEKPDRPPRDDKDDTGQRDTEETHPDPNRAPRVQQVRIEPSVVYVDGPVTCSAQVTDDDGDDIDVAYQWENATTGRSVGTGEEITLSPERISPGEILECTVTATDPSGESASGSAQKEPVCGFYDLASLEDVDAEIYIFFRPYKTEDLDPGFFVGEPWDWDGDIPDEVFDLADFLSDLLDVVTTVYPDPTLLTAAEYLEYATAVAQAVDEYAPVLLEPYVPPDPDLFPYMLDEEGYIYPFYDGDDGLQWEDSYEVVATARNVDMDTYPVLAIDLEDIDLVIDDNMGDYIDQGDYPLLLSWEVFAEGAYCTSSYVNPTDEAQSTDISFVPSSVLMMQIEVH